MQVIRDHNGDVHACYARVALKDPTVQGRLTLQWTIGKDGMPIGVAITQDTLKDKSVGACLKERARHWQFAPPGGGVQVISYPFDLSVQ
ncbi:MAG: AgmX/PglI C-terminal domain-containing protein [bacterium]